MDMHQKGFVNIVLIIVVVAIVVIGGYFVFSKKSEPIAQQQSIQPTNGNGVAQTNLKTYRSAKYGFEINYPADDVVVENGPDSYELQLREGKQISGTQEPLLESIDFKNHNKQNFLTVNVPDHKSFPVVSEDYKWWLRPCGSEGFAIIKSQDKILLAGYKTLHVVSVPDTDKPSTNETHFYCVNFPQNPLILYYSQAMKEQADAIISTLKFYK